MREKDGQPQLRDLMGERPYHHRWEGRRRWERWSPVWGKDFRWGEQHEQSIENGSCYRQNCTPQNLWTQFLKNRTLFGNRVCAFKQIKMKSLEWALIQYGCFLTKGKFGWRERTMWTWRRGLGKAPAAKKCASLLKTTRSWKKSLEKILLSSFLREHNPSNILNLDFWPPELRDSKFLLF